jgi:hypothetical protein
MQIPFNGERRREKNSIERIKELKDKFYNFEQLI